MFCLDGNNVNPEASIVRLVGLVVVDLLLNPLDSRLVVCEGVSVAITIVAISLKTYSGCPGCKGCSDR